MIGRNLSSFVLSAVFLPVLLLASFHHHGTYTETACEGCSQNIPHSHLDQNTDDCLVCQFLTFLWLTSSETGSCAPAQDNVSLEDTLVSGPHCTVAESLSTRAPPVFFC